MDQAGLLLDSDFAHDSCSSRGSAGDFVINVWVEVAL